MAETQENSPVGPGGLVGPAPLVGIDPFLTAPTPVQTTYPTVMPVGVAGMPATMTTWDADTRICETVAGIGFGLAVSQGSGTKGVIIGGTTAGFQGVSYRDITLIAACGFLDLYPQYANMGVMVRGDIWVAVEAAVTIASAVIFNAATGQFGAATGQTITQAKYIIPQATPGGLALLRMKVVP